MNTSDRVPASLKLLFSLCLILFMSACGTKESQTSIGEPQQGIAEKQESSEDPGSGFIDIPLPEDFPEDFPDPG